MTVLYIILGIIAFILLLLIIPLNLKITFDGNLKIRVRYLFIGLTLYPVPEKPSKTEKQVAKGEKRARKKVQHEAVSTLEEMLQEEGVAATIKYFSEIARLAGTAAKRFMRALTIDRLCLNVIVASEDAAQTATDYGKACAVIYPAEVVIESTMHVRHRKISITTDFLREKGKVNGEIRLHGIPIRILWIVLLFFMKFIGITDNSSNTSNTNNRKRETAKKGI